MARNLIAGAATLALFLHVPAAWGDEPEDSASSGMLTIHGVIDAMTAEAALVTEGECQPREDFELFTGGDARVRRFSVASGRVDAVLACASGSLLWVTLYPDQDPSMRYRFFFVEAGVAADRQGEDGEWERICDNGSCSESVPGATRAAWQSEWSDFSTLSTRVGELFEAFGETE